MFADDDGGLRIKLQKIVLTSDRDAGRKKVHICTTGAQIGIITTKRFEV